MKYLRALLARVVGMFTGHRHDTELRAELQEHLELEIAENLRRGLPPDEARRQALLASGGLVQAAEAVRDRRGLPALESLAADFRYALRTLSRSPGFSLVAVLTLALGIGANTAIFSVVRGVLLRPLPHREGDRLVYLRQSADGPGRANMGFSVPEVRDFREGAPAFGGIAEHSTWTAILQEADAAERISVGLVTGNFFEVMGLGPVLGRVTSAGDDGPGVPPVMVLTHQYWMKRFGGDSSIVGKQVRLDGAPVTVIGVVQAAPYFPARTDAFLNMVFSPHHLSAQMVQGRSHRMTEMVARLAPGATVPQARSQVAAVYARMQADHPEAYDAGAHFRVALTPFQEVMGEGARLTLALLMAAAAFVLIIAAANVANLTLMRGVRRAHEFVARAALGAGVARLRRLLLAENLLLTLVGGGLGVLLAIGGVRLLTSFAARYSPRANEIRLDGMVLGFTFLLAVALALLLAFAAALPREGTLAAWLSAGGRRLSGSLRKQRLQRGLVVAQVAVSVVLLAGAGLLTRSMIALANVRTGLESEEMLTMTVPLVSPTQLITNPQADAMAKQRYEAIRRELRGLPGVVEVGIGSTMPLTRSAVMFDVKAEGRALAAGEAIPSAELRTASPEFFRAAGIPLLQGRPFAATDQAASGKVVILNQVLADRLFPGEDPVGRRIAWTGQVLRFAGISDEWRTIVGVVATTQDGGLDATPRPVVFLPFTQFLAIGGGLVIRVESEAERFVPATTAVVRRLAPGVPIENVLTISQIKDQSVSPRRLNAQLISSFGVLALLIAAVGIAGVLAFSVSARTTEIGIRMSLGADSGRVQRMILREGGGLLLLGLLLGVPGALLAGRAIRGLLFGVPPYDPATYLLVAAIMAVIGVAACWIPALRAARVDPAVTMRSE